MPQMVREEILTACRCFSVIDKTATLTDLVDTEIRAEKPRAFRRIADNALALFALQGLTYLVSFLTVPYLLRTLGTSHFGSLAFANTVMAQFILLTDFGFASSATRLVAIHSKDQERLGVLFSAVMTVKVLLLGLSALIVSVLAFAVPRFHGDRAVMLMAFLQVIGSVLFPGWLFQGLERMRLITVISIVARLISTGLIFLVVHGPGDTVLSMACQSAGVVFQGLIALYFAVVVLRIRPVTAQRQEVWNQVKDSFHPFLGASMGNLVGGSSVLFLGMFKDMITVGGYAAIERTARAEVLAMLPAAQAAYPHISQRFHEGLTSGNRAFIRLSTCLLTGALLFVGGVAFFSPKILHLLYGAKLLGESRLFSTFSIWSFLSLLNTLLGLHYLIASGHSKAYGRSVFWSAALTIVCFVTLIPRLGSWGGLLAVIFGEVLQTVLMLLAIWSINRLHQEAVTKVS
ncbi:MAG: oligosaccharide flippase family protein [Janthinobacterium lividum]